MDRFCVELAGDHGMRIALGIALGMALGMALQQPVNLTGCWNACKLFVSAIEIRSGFSKMTLPGIWQ